MLDTACHWMKCKSRKVFILKWFEKTVSTQNILKFLQPLKYTFEWKLSVPDNLEASDLRTALQFGLCIFIGNSIA